jgi:hypothetical protein
MTTPPASFATRQSFLLLNISKLWDMPAIPGDLRRQE